MSFYNHSYIPPTVLVSKPSLISMPALTYTHTPVLTANNILRKFANLCSAHRDAQTLSIY